MKPEPLTPFEQVIFDALQSTDEVVTYGQFAKLKVPKRPPASEHNRFTVHIKEIRRKTGVIIETVRGVGYKLLDRT